MRRLNLTFAVLIALSLSAPTIFAADFDWLSNLSVQAQADPTGFRARLGTRFSIGDVDIRAVLSTVDYPADAYMVFRFCEITGYSPSYVMERYQTHKKKGWGALAQSLGIKPGSTDFHALKAGHDLDKGGKENNIQKVKSNNHQDKGGGKGKGKGK
jgi:hypothetical protein